MFVWMMRMIVRVIVSMSVLVVMRLRLRMNFDHRLPPWLGRYVTMGMIVCVVMCMVVIVVVRHRIIMVVTTQSIFHTKLTVFAAVTRHQ